MRNQPKYNFFKNTTYALKGLQDLLKNESSFKIELLLFFLLLPALFFIETTLSNKLLMFISLMLMLIAEAANSAIERVVDLVTLEHHEMAGRAKDVGSAVVFLSISLFVVVWVSILLSTFL
ncbi:MAG: diacylglycerol kinase [Sulfurimonas sp.]|uniref:diacylglycerol kinase n=1 Tax=Sulfurimonas sp. TaxID=2022749 RepID=UPI00262EC63D|nr:diacylglycerol kinase [Sulfurimonas sp.]MDD2653097.1 diacylglycerol kinase [Sulfurimonas sp.]MDD3452480.1 diacylglycerol kinase [Sulfurimonas sp.]